MSSSVSSPPSTNYAAGLHFESLMNITFSSTLMVDSNSDFEPFTFTESPEELDEYSASPEFQNTHPTLHVSVIDKIKRSRSSFEVASEREDAPKVKRCKTDIGRLPALTRADRYNGQIALGLGLPSSFPTRGVGIIAPTRELPSPLYNSRHPVWKDDIKISMHTPLLAISPPLTPWDTPKSPDVGIWTLDAMVAFDTAPLMEVPQLPEFSELLGAEFREYPLAGTEVIGLGISFIPDLIEISLDD
ncbi:hypothetical protein K474DRAFT_462679 [Panus rudis PR-1116 ss-1]|nr:hypothetical protein K474DRAFT_462679 [Panus rudis PR-1116 ss-1]